MRTSSKTEAINGKDNSTIMTPLRVKEAIEANPSGPAYTEGDAISLANNQIAVKYDNTTITLDQNGKLKATASGTVTDVKQNNVSVVTDGVASVTVPTKVSDLTNDADYADKAFVNSSIATSTANFRGTSAKGLTEQQFLAWADTLTKTNNDYIFWDTVDASGNTVFKRYKYNGTNWVYEYTLNNSSFTSAQWAAINSGITQTDKQNYDDANQKKHTHTNKSVLDGISQSDIDAWDAKQDKLVSGQNIKTINNNSILGPGNIEIEANPEVYIQNTEPTDEDWKLWVDPDEELTSLGTEVVNSLEGDETYLAPSVAAVNDALETKTILYNGYSNTNITLNDNINNYQYIEIIYCSNDGSDYLCSTGKLISDGSIVTSCSYSHFVSDTMYVKFSEIQLQNNSLFFISAVQYYFLNGSTMYINEASNIYIKRVIGYK